MEMKDWVAIGGLLTAVAAGAVYVGSLNERVIVLERLVPVLERRITALENDPRVGNLEGRVNVLEPRVGNLEGRVNVLRSEARAVAVEVVLGGENMGPYTWRTGLPAEQMIPASEGICFLSKVKGEYGGPGEAVSVDIADGFWKLHGQSDRHMVWAEARCWRFPELVPE